MIHAFSLIKNLHADLMVKSIKVACNHYMIFLPFFQYLLHSAYPFSLMLMCLDPEKVNWSRCGTNDDSLHTGNSY